MGGGPSTYEYQMHSIDVLTAYWEDTSKPIGFMGEVAKQILGVKSHSLYRGTILPNIVDKIGGDIDFVVLDTAHLLPGEILDFLVVLPYLKSDAVICLHDIAEQHYQNKLEFATGALFASVNANKIINLLPVDSLSVKWPNIGAFQVTSETKTNILDVVLALSLPWGYLMPPEQMRSYSNAIHKLYDEDVCKIYDEAVKINLLNLIMATYK